MINEDGVVPNNVTFSTVFTALRNLLPPDEKRFDAVRTVFQTCVELGMCSSSVTQRLQSLLNVNQLKELVGEDRVQISGAVINELLPEEWTRNVQSRPKKKFSKYGLRRKK